MFDKLIALPDNVRIMNKTLEQLYGYARGNNPLYRVTWANNETEVRFGTFNDFHGEIFIRQVRERRTVQKYWWCKDNWIIERYVSLPGVEGYEVIWVLWGPNQEPLPPRWDVISEIVYVNYHGHGRLILPTDQRQSDNEHERAVKAEAAPMREILDNESSPLMSAFHEGSAVIIRRQDGTSDGPIDSPVPDPGE